MKHRRPYADLTDNPETDRPAHCRGKMPPRTAGDAGAMQIPSSSDNLVAEFRVQPHGAICGIYRFRAGV
jgi:hypothetical protein